MKHLPLHYKRNFVLAISLLLLGLLFLYRDEWFILRVMLTIFVPLIFYMTDNFFSVHFRLKHYFFILIIAITGCLFSPLYYLYVSYDKVLHYFQPILICSIVFYAVSKLKIEHKWKIIFTFFIVLGTIGVFEIGEYTLDHFFDLKLQGVYLRDTLGLEKYNIVQDRIDDTMADMTYGLIGCLTYVVFEIMNNRRKKKLIHRR